ncbi:MAG: gamma-glutamyl-gamma-aminobutyrate hydrolase family protein [Candidatus Kapabacteria bacterium]|nr:gamma-glutamyl-gamma-aminobutyrate hydrolase family protein [Candidatus Kapabacteria bacterium]
MKIALSKASGTTEIQNVKYAKYIEWLTAANPDVETVDLSQYDRHSAPDQLKECSGIIFTGGADVVPERYGKPEDYDRCHVDHERDELEFALVHQAHELNMPILGICRGAQVLNVAFGGTLIVDIPTDTQSTIEHRSNEGIDEQHNLEVESGSMIKKICGVMEGTVNSAHHQAVEHLSGFFRKAATSPDGIIEAFEVSERSGNSFILCVQWHPERMDYSNPLSLPIAQHFLFECESYDVLVKGKSFESLLSDIEEHKNQNYE